MINLFNQVIYLLNHNKNNYIVFKNILWNVEIIVKKGANKATKNLKTKYGLFLLITKLYICHAHIKDCRETNSIEY
jgi:hypothetical protein